MYEDISSFRGTEISSRVYYVTYTASALVHVLFFAAFILMPELGRQHYQMPQSISVSLVSLPGPPELSGIEGQPKNADTADTEAGTAPATVMEDDTEVEAQKPREPEKSATESEPVSEPEPVPEPEPAEPPPVPIAPVIEPKATVVIPDAPEKKEKPEVKPDKSNAPKLPEEQIVRKKKNPQAQKPKDAQKEVVKPAEGKRQGDSRSESIKDAVDRIRRSVGKKSAQSGAGRSGSGGDGGNSTSRGRPGGGPGGEIGNIYGQQLAYHIQQNWAFSSSLAGGRRDLLSILRITILSDGHITEIDFEQRSGNNYLDESAYRAVMKSDPLPPPPGGASEYTVGLRFTPDGLN